MLSAAIALCPVMSVSAATENEKKSTESAAYSINDGEEVEYKDGDKITLESSQAEGGAAALTLRGKIKDGVNTYMKFYFTKPVPDYTLVFIIGAAAAAAAVLTLVIVFVVRKKKRRKEKLKTETNRFQGMRHPVYSVSAGCLSYSCQAFFLYCFAVAFFRRNVIVFHDSIRASAEVYTGHPRTLETASL